MSNHEQIKNKHKLPYNCKLWLSCLWD